MKKILFLYLTFVSLAFGYNYDEVLLKAQAAIFPKIVLLDKKIENKLVDGKIVYTIVYDKPDYNIATSIEKYIDKNFQGHLGSYEYRINLVEIESFTDSIETTAIYVLNLKDEIENIAFIAKERGIISFSYDINYLRRGLMFSLLIEKSTVLYLTKDNLYTKKIEFVDALLQIVRFIEKENYASKEKKLKEKSFNNNQVDSNNFYASLFGSIF